MCAVPDAKDWRTAARAVRAIVEGSSQLHEIFDLSQAATMLQQQFRRPRRNVPLRPRTTELTDRALETDAAVRRAAKNAFRQQGLRPCKPQGPVNGARKGSPAVGQRLGGCYVFGW